MKAKIESETGTKQTGETVVKEKEEKELHFCKDCKFYDKGSEREFHRKVGPRNDKGERPVIVEIKAICRNEKARAGGHLVMAEYSKRQCPQWEQGVYEAPKTEKPNMPTITDEMKIGDIIEWEDPQTKEMLTFKVVRVGRHGRRLSRQKQTQQQSPKEETKSTKKQKSKGTVVTNVLNGETATVEKRGRKTVIVKA